MDSIDVKLADAGRLSSTGSAESEALQAVFAARAAEARKRRRRRTLLPALSVGGVLALMGAGAAVATQWGPWNYVPEADIVIAREWTDVAGNSLGACESRLAIDTLTPEARDAARAYLAEVDVDALQPDPEIVALLLVSVDRAESMGRLVAGASVADFDVTLAGPAWDGAWWSDARILQDGLTRSVFAGMSDHLIAEWPELNTAESSIGSNIQTQCTTDPVRGDQQ